MSSILLQMTVIIGSTRVQLRLAQLCLWVVGSVGCILCVWLKLLAHTVALVMSVFWCVWAVVTLWPLHTSTLASVQVFCWSCRAHSFSGTAFHCKSVSRLVKCSKQAGSSHGRLPPGCPAVTLPPGLSASPNKHNMLFCLPVGKQSP